MKAWSWSRDTPTQSDMVRYTAASRSGDLQAVDQREITCTRTNPSMKSFKNVKKKDLARVA